jgi:nuclear GTP-binding protein
MLMSVWLCLEARKDPGIPNLWPFKEELLKRMEEQKRHETVLREKSRNEQKSKPSKLSTNDEQRLVTMRKEAERKDQQFEISSINRESNDTLWKGGEFYQ